MSTTTCDAGGVAPPRTLLTVLLAALAACLATLMGLGGSDAAAAVPSNYVVQYQGQVQNYGWTTPMADGSPIGTTGRSLRLEAFTAKLNPAIGGHVCYQADVQSRGYYQGEQCDGAPVGTTGLSLALWHVRLHLNGLPSTYHLCYSAYVQDTGWMSEVCDGAEAGRLGLRIESLRIHIRGIGSGQSVTLPTNFTGPTQVCIHNMSLQPTQTGYYSWQSGPTKQSGSIAPGTTYCFIRYYLGYNITVTNTTTQSAGVLLEVYEPSGPQT